MRTATDGVSLASIVAKETSEGSWTGSGAGVGVGTGGFGVFVGGMSGTKREQTLRAKEFQAPARAKYNWMRVIAPILVLVATWFVFGVTGELIDSNVDAPASASPAAATSAALSAMTAILTKFVPLILFGVAALWFACGGFDRRKDAEEKRYKEARARDAVLAEIYQRLRYVEADHTVFDPTTMKEVPATAPAIEALMQELAEEAEQKT
ncbi:hypothetical protein [Xanthomonas campestris]|uniref:hypothetical protein n=1 Tax=Xanthomonas campestris TaxID=339 RepID=UPI002379820B|nr:hypothetical protein [Xanthomonas campestris]WDK04528.1 hypothetical protein JH273_21670 [Xanthomonas campestris]